jgi:hypothetical protein
LWGRECLDAHTGISVVIPTEDRGAPVFKPKRTGCKWPYTPLSAFRTPKALAPQRGIADTLGRLLRASWKRRAVLIFVWLPSIECRR